MRRITGLILAAVMAVTMLVLPVSAATTGSSEATRKTVQVILPAELMKQLEKDGFQLTRFRVQMRDADSTVPVLKDFDTVQSSATIEIAPNEIFYFMHRDDSLGHFVESLWFMTDDLIKAADGDGVIDVGFANPLYNFNSKLYFNGNYKASVKWVDSAPAASTDDKYTATIGSEPALKVRRLFEKFFSNQFLVIDLGRSQDFSKPTRIEVGFDEVSFKNAVFYAYDATSNTYHKITDPQPKWEAGKLSLTTTKAGAIVISMDGAITKK